MRKLTSDIERGSGLVSYPRFKTHCEMHPDWGVEAWRISRINTCAIKTAQFRKMTHCKHGHTLADAYVSQANGYGKRNCRTCLQIRNAIGPVPKPEDILRAKAALENGLTLNRFLHGKLPGGGPVNRALVIMNVQAFYRHRRENQEFHQFVLDAIEKRRGASFLAAAPNTYKYDWRDGDDRVIAAMLPAWLADKDDVVNDIMIALFEGRLDRTQLGLYVKRFVRARCTMFPTKYARFGNSPLLSLDEALFDDGGGTRGDYVSRGLWD